ncbi:MAG: heme exporter protein CcmB [Thalassobaculaceae bacterium]|jgi:heme exporter protein B|tara:strand:+ start:625 stop:1290 length:666 start_codon:yes stop_codon:yes gene_type:complete
MDTIMAIIRRDLSLVMRQGSDAFVVLIFFIVTVTLFPLGVSPDPLILQNLASGIVWVGALLAAMLSLDRLFQTDYDDGSLELLVLSPYPLEIVVLCKCFVHWLTTGLPIMVISPVLALMLNIKTGAFLYLITSMALGTPIISLLGAVGAALVLGSRRSGVLIALLIIPLTIPILLFGVGAIQAATEGYSASSPLMFLGAFLLFSIALCPWVIASSLRQVVS